MKLNFSRKLRLIVVILCLGFAQASMLEISKDYADFTAIEVKKGVDLIVRYSSDFSVLLRVDESIRKEIVIAKRGKTLSIDAIGYPKGKTEVLVTMPELKSVTVLEGSDASITGFKRENTVKLVASQAASINANLSAEALTLEAYQAANIRFQGDTKMLSLKASQAANISFKGNAQTIAAEGDSAAKLDVQASQNQNSKISLSHSSRAELFTDGVLNITLRDSRLNYCGDAVISQQHLFGFTSRLTKSCEAFATFGG